MGGEPSWLRGLNMSRGELGDGWNGDGADDKAVDESAMNNPNKREINMSQAALEVVARTVHEANRAVCIALGDNSQPHWEDAADDARASTFAQINGAVAGETPEQNHASWRASKLAAGWTYGPVKDVAAKVHPDLIGSGFNDLPHSSRVKDLVFTGVACAVLDAYGIERVKGALTFGAAVEVLKTGGRVARAGWNGKGMWLALIPGSGEIGGFPVQDCIGMKTADGKMQPGWLASQADILATDWAAYSI